MTKLKLVKTAGSADPPAQIQPLSQYGDLLTVADVSRETGLCGKVVREYCASGKLPGVKIGSRWFIPKSKFIEAVGLGAA